LKKKILIAAVLLAIVVGVRSFGTAYHNRVPHIVDKESFTGQTTAIASTTLFSPASDDSLDYRVSIYDAMNTQANTKNNTVVISWFDEFNNSQTISATANVGNGSSPTFQQASFVVHLYAGTSLTMYTYANGTPTYDVFVTVEEL